MKNMKTVETAALAATIALAACFAGCGKKDHSGEMAQMQQLMSAVKVAHPLKKDIVMWDEYTSRIDAIEFVEVRARVGGYLEKVYFKEGQHVNAGDLLFEIDPRPIKASLDAADAVLKEVEARLQLAESNLSRAKELYANKAISKEIYETRNSEYLSAKAALMNAKARQKEAALNLEYTQIRAPISGRMSEVLVDIGNLVNANSTMLTTIVNSDVVQAYFEASERDVLRYKKMGLFDKIDLVKHTGPVAQIRPMESEDWIAEGVCNYYDNRMGAETSSLTMRADFDNKKGLLTPGMFAKIRIKVNPSQSVLLLPEDIIGTDLVGRYALAVNKDGVVEYRALKLGRLLGKYRVIESGISENDNVVVEGLQRAVPGRKVSAQSVELK